MPIRQKIVVSFVGFFIFFFIIYLVREKKLKEEYSWLWLLVGTGVLAIAFNYDWLLFLTRLIGAALPTSTLFFFGLISLVLISLQFSIRISQLTEEHKNIVQKVAIMDQELGLLMDNLKLHPDSVEKKLPCKPHPSSRVDGAQES